MATQLHLTEDTFTLHLLLERLERLVDIVVANENLHLAAYSSQRGTPPIGTPKKGRSACPDRKTRAITCSPALANAHLRPI